MKNSTEEERLASFTLSQRKYNQSFWISFLRETRAGKSQASIFPFTLADVFKFLQFGNFWRKAPFSW